MKRNIFLISQPKHMLWLIKRTVSMSKHPKHILKLTDKVIFTILRLFFFFYLSGPMTKVLSNFKNFLKMHAHLSKGTSSHSFPSESTSTAHI